MKRGLPPKGVLTGMGSDSDEGMSDEEGEEEQDENADEDGEEEMEVEDDENQDEFVSDNGSDAPPQVIPITKDTNAINNERQEADEEVSDINLDDYESSSEYDSDDLDPNCTENPHGFVFGNMLETFSKSRSDRIEEMRELKEKNGHRDKFKKKQSSKLIGKSERVH